MDSVSELIMRSQEGDKDAREQLIEENMGLVHHVARRFFGRGVEAEDLFQIGAIGLMKAIDRFDLQFSVKFSTYAVPMIAGEIKRFLRDDSMIKVSRSLKELAVRAGYEKERFCMREGREPDVQELADLLGVEKEELVQALDSSAEVESLQKTMYQSDGDGFCLLDKMAESTVDVQEETLQRVLLEKVLSQLTPKERELIVLRFFYDKTQSQVAERLGMSQVQVSRLEKKVLLRMRGMIL